VPDANDRGVVGAVRAAFSRTARPLRGKANTEAVIGQHAGWSTTSSVGRWGTARTGNRVTSPLNTYGGTDESSVWVFACVTVRSQQLSAYPWWLHGPGAPNVPLPRDTRRPEVLDLYELLKEPNSEMHYADWAEQVQMDLDLTGNSFWLLDQQDGLGRPRAIEWLAPGTIKVATDDARRRRIGYVYEPQTGGPKIAYGLNEVLHFRNRNPRNRWYGMGVVEAIVRAVDKSLANDHHVTAFFDDGGNLSGILTVPDTIGEEEFERVKDQYRGEMKEAGFGILVAEGATGYIPVSSNPAAIGTIELGRASKDEIFSGFGVPEFLVGGTGQGGVYKMEEAQNILHRTMIPLAGRFMRRVDVDLANRFALDVSTRKKVIGFHVDVRQSDTPSTKIDRARKMVGTGASIDQIMETAGFDRYEWSGVTDAPLIPSGLVPVSKEGFELVAGQNTPPPQPGATERQDPTDEPGGDGDANDPVADSDRDEQKTVPELVENLAAAPPRLWATQHVDRVRASAAALRAERAAQLGTARDPDAPDPASADVVEGWLRAQRDRVLGVMTALKSSGALKGLAVEDLLDEAAELRDLEQRLLDSGLSGAVDPQWVTRSVDAVRGVLREAQRRTYSPTQAFGGVPIERFPGVVGVYDDLLRVARSG
jgi:HK97 family phage portal protein